MVNIGYVINTTKVIVIEASENDSYVDEKAKPTEVTVVPEPLIEPQAEPVIEKAVMPLEFKDRAPASSAVLKCGKLKVNNIPDGPGAVDMNCGTGNQDCGKPITAAYSGVVTANYGNGYGTMVAIKRSDKNCVSIYAHLGSVKKAAQVGKTVKAGTIIGTMGNTGNSKTCHLHYESCNGRLYKTASKPRKKKRTSEAELPWGTVPMGEEQNVVL